MRRKPTPQPLRATFLLLAACSGSATAATLPEGSPECTRAAAGNSVEHLRAACQPGREAGNPVDAFNLAIGLRDAEPEAAMEHLLWAADAGLAEAAHLLGNMLLDAGEGGDGLEYLAAAARAGLPIAQFDYATALLEARGPEEREAILYWYGQAAANGEQSARYNLGVLYLEGHLGAADPLLAWAWFASLPELEGHPQVYRLVNRLAREMKPEERRRAESLRDRVRNDPTQAIGITH